MRARHHPLAKVTLSFCVSQRTILSLDFFDSQSGSFVVKKSPAQASTAVGKNKVNDIGNEGAPESSNSVRRWRLSLPVWTLIGVFVVGLSTVLANLVGVFDYFDGGLDAPTPSLDRAASLNTIGESTTPSRGHHRSQETLSPRKPTTKTYQQPAFRPQPRTEASRDQPPGAPSAGDYSVIVSNSPHANTHTTYNINGTEMGPEQ